MQRPVSLAITVLSLVVSAAGQEIYSIEKERALGKALSDGVSQTLAVLDSPAAQALVQRMGQRLTEQISDNPFDYQLTVVRGADASLIEPIALPGGYLFVPAELFVEAENEAEFAGILAHSIEHVALRHGTRRTEASTVNRASIPLIFMGGWRSPSSRGMAVPLGFLKYQREYELEADQHAVGLLSKAGYNPAGLLTYISRMQTPLPGTMKAAFSPLPDRDLRLESLRTAVDQEPARTYDQDSDFPAVREQVRELLNRTPPGPVPSLRRQ